MWHSVEVSESYVKKLYFCPSGNFGTVPTGCNVCPAGKYSTFPQTLDCDSCDAGKSTIESDLAADHDAQSDCSKCRDGEYSLKGEPCIECPAGKYASSKTERCKICEAGKYNTSPRSQMCTVCPGENNMWLKRMSTTTTRNFKSNIVRSWNSWKVQPKHSH